MRRHLIWTTILALAAATAVPALAAEGTTGAIGGAVEDGVTGMPFPTGGSHLVVIDAYHTATMQRYRVLGVDAVGAYTIPNLPLGYYKVRFRYADASGLNRYLWYGGTQSFDTATLVHVLGGALSRVDVSIPLTPGAPVSGIITERGSGAPLGNADPATPCYFAQLYEASGIGIGQIASADAAGVWSVQGLAPAGSLTAVAGYSKWCADSPPHLDRWYMGASGWPFQPDNLVAEARTFATARLFTVADGVPVTGIDLALMPAPACAGKVPTIFGTTLADRITGTAGPDVIVGLAGRDRILGLGGNDVICGNAGRDRLIGNAGRDRLLGNLGDDLLRGGLGDDVLRGGRGMDTADGGAGADVCVAETVGNCP
jgi:hypothetical protein